jgi:hypothetical protein
MPTPGYIYVLSNPAMSSMVKIGKTTNAPHVRARELSISTGVPLPFKVEGYFVSNDIAQDENFIHFGMQELRVNGKREFFYGSVDKVREFVKHAMREVTWLDGSVEQHVPTPPAPPRRPVVLPPPPHLEGEARKEWLARGVVLHPLPPIAPKPNFSVTDEVLRTLHPVRQTYDRDYRHRHDN